MALGTLCKLGDVVLDDATFQMPVYLGPDVQRWVVRQPATRTAELMALPYIVALSITTSAEPGTAQPAHMEQVFAGLRVLEIRQVNNLVCEVHLADCRADLAHLVCPSDFNLLWQDGYLDDTNYPTLKDAVQFLGVHLEPLRDALAADAFAGVPETAVLPDSIPVAGSKLLPALEALADAAGCNLAVNHLTGLLYFARRGTAATVALNVYNWAEGFEPSWVVANRKQRGLPRAIRCYYQERHAIRVQQEDPRRTSSNRTLQIEMRQVYATGTKFLTLAELLVEFGLAETAITDSQLCRVINTENFDGTALEPVGGFDVEAKQLIQIIKRDWRTLWKVVFVDQLGRRGGWIALQPGYFLQVTDKDGRTRYTEDVVARAVRAEHTQWLAKAESTDAADQSTLAGAVVARSYGRARAEDPLPDAPFAATWVSEADNVIRITPSPKDSEAQLMWLGRMAARDELTITDFGPPTDDRGVTHGTIGGIQIPEVKDVVFSTDFDLEVFFVGTRRLPNTSGKWTQIEEVGFDDGDVEVLEVEVGDELYAIRDYVDAADGKADAGDGFGLLLNREAIEADAARRIAAVRERLAVETAGEGTAWGLQAAVDLQLGDGIRAMAIEVDGVLVQTVVSVGPTDSEENRQRRAARRNAARRLEVGGKVAAV